MASGKQVESANINSEAVPSISRSSGASTYAVPHSPVTDLWVDWLFMAIIIVSGVLMGLLLVILD